MQISIIFRIQLAPPPTLPVIQTSIPILDTLAKRKFPAVPTSSFNKKTKNSCNQSITSSQRVSSSDRQSIPQKSPSKNRVGPTFTPQFLNTTNSCFANASVFLLGNIPEAREHILSVTNQSNRLKPLNCAFSANNADIINIGNVIPLVHPSLGHNEQEDVAVFMPMLTHLLKFDQTNIFPQHSVTKYKCRTCAHESESVDPVSPLNIVNINKQNPNLINGYKKSMFHELEKNCTICGTCTLHTKNEVTQSSYLMIQTATIQPNKEVDRDAHVPGIGHLSLQGFITREGRNDDSGHFYYNHLTSEGSVILDDQKPKKIVADDQTTQQNICGGYIYLYKVTNNTIEVSNPATSIPSSPPHSQIPLAHPTLQVHTTPLTQPPFQINTPISTTVPTPTDQFQHIREVFNSSTAHIPEYTVLKKLNLNEIRSLLPGQGRAPKKNKSKKELINELLRHKLKEEFSTFSDFQAAPSEIGIPDATNIMGILNAKRPGEKDNVILIERINQLRQIDPQHRVPLLVGSRTTEDNGTLLTPFDAGLEQHVPIDHVREFIPLIQPGYQSYKEPEICVNPVPSKNLQLSPSELLPESLPINPLQLSLSPTSSILEAINSSIANIPDLKVLMQLQNNEIRMLLPGDGPKRNKSKTDLINDLLRLKLKELLGNFSDFQAAASQIGNQHATNIMDLLFAKLPRIKDNVILIKRINQLRQMCPQHRVRFLVGPITTDENQTLLTPSIAGLEEHVVTNHAREFIPLIQPQYEP